jgi:peptide/nickel transport system substrate-binding protein
MRWWTLRLLAASLMAGAAAAEAGAPAEPRVLDDIPQVGRPGGELRTLIGTARDTRLLYVYGRSRLVTYTPALEMVPDLVESFAVDEGRKFTFKLRQGHRWSDGAPFTAEDFRFWWEDVAQHPKLTPAGVPIRLTVQGEPPTVTFPDATTVVYEWSKPNPFLLPTIAATAPEFIYAPAHYLKQFHERYADPAALAQAVKGTRSRDWAQLFGRKERMNRVDNPDLPTLEPWMLVTAPPAERFVAERNPHFHRVDANGQQLPYLDRVILEVVDSKLIPIKTGAGETDIQSRGLFFKDYTFLRESEARNGLRTFLWREARPAHLALYPNLNAADPVWRALFRDRRFRLALSKALDREAVSEYLYFGLATPANNTVLDDSPLYTESVGAACLGHDAAAANRLLDELGLRERTPDGLRRLPDGRPMELLVETAGEDTEQVDVLELVREDWLALGIRIHSKPSDREVFRNRVFSGDALITVWYGLENGIPTADMSPHEFAPTSQFDQLQWPKWGQWYETKGKAGEAPDLPAAVRLSELFAAWGVTATTAEREPIWREMLEIYASECFTIGTVADVMQPVVVRNGLRNVPEEAIYNWEPHAQLGIYRPDTFWWDR